MKYIAPFFWIVFILFSFNKVSAQVEKDTLQAWQYYQKADSLLQARKMDSSIVYFKKALPVYEKYDELERVAACYNGLSDNQLRIYELDEAFVNAKKALTICQKHFSEYHFQAAYAFDNIAKFYLRSSDIDRALELHTKALEIRKEILPEIHFEKAKSYSNLALIYTHLSKYQEALHYNNKALKIMIEVLGPDHPKNGIIYNNLGVISERMGRFDEAIKYHKKKIEIMSEVYGNEHLFIAQAYVNIGGVFQHIKQNKKALDNYKKALKFYEKSSINNNDLAVIYNNIGSVLRDNGEYDQALDYYKKSIKLDTKILGKNNAVLSSDYLNIGGLYNTINENNKALFYYDKALELLESVSKYDLEIESKLHLNKGNVYRNQEKYDLALESYQKSTNILIGLFGKYYEKVADNYSLISDLFLEKGDRKNANLYLNKTWEILKNKSWRNNPTITKSINRIAEIYYAQKKYDKAVLFYNKALTLNTKNKSYSTKIDKYNLDNYYDLQVLIRTLKGKAKSFMSLYEMNKDINLIDSSFAVFGIADSLLFKLNQTYQSHKDKISLAEKRKKIYEASIALQLILNKDYGNKKVLDKAFYYSERSRSSILQESLTDIELNNDILLPKAISYFNSNLKVNKSILQSQLINERSKTSIDSIKTSEYEDKLFNINRKQDSLNDVIKKNYPKYHQLKYKNEVASAADIQNNLDTKTTLLEFFTTDSITYAFTISKNDLAVKQLSTPNLQQDIERLRKSIIDKNVNAFKSQSYNLYKQLINPIKDQLIGDQLIIVPDGPLWHLNFDLLLTETTNSNNPKELPYWLKKYTISYANSATMLFNSFKNQKKPNIAQECLAFSFSDSTNVAETKTMSLATLRDSGDDLPGTREEIRAISNIINGQYFFGSQAIEANFKNNADKYSMLHLALHGEVDNERPENSKLFFTKSNDTIEDNFLYSHELFALNIPAELTVLSACNTGSGKIAKGEGIMSLGNAFQYAGAKSLLLTGWEVSDQTTPDLMKYFYKNLKKGMSKAKALRQAKLQYLSTANVNRTHPFYWGGFYLVGDPAPIHFDDNSMLYWILGLSVLLILFLALFWFKRKKQNS